MAELASFIVHVNEDGTLTTSGFTVGEGVSHDQAVAAVQGAMPGSAVAADPWAPQGDQAPWPGGAQAATATSPPASPMASYYGQTQPAAPPGPVCVHGPLKIVPGGIAKTGARAGQPYPAFWACPAARGQQCRLDKNALPPIPQ